MTAPGDAKEDANRRLLAAVHAGDARAAAAALSAGADVETWDDAAPVLFTACKRKDVAMARLLLDHGADPKAEWLVSEPFNFERRPCLFAALPDSERVEGSSSTRMRQDQVEASAAILEALLLKGADPNAPCSWREEVHHEWLLLDDDCVKQTPRLAELLKRFGARSAERRG